MKSKERISRRDALKRMSKAALAVAVASVFPSVNALAEETNYYDNCDDYSNYGNYHDYRNYDDYGNYSNYTNYRDYNDCY